MNPQYSDMLTFLQGLLGQQQQTNTSQYQQGLGFQQQQLTAQQQEYAANLANQQALQTLQNSGQLANTNAQNSGQLANTNAQGQNAINLQAPQLALQGSEFNTTTANQMQQQLCNQQQQTNASDFTNSPAYRAAILQSMAGSSGGSPSGGTAANPQTPQLTYAGRSGSGTVRPNNPTDLLNYFRFQNSGF